MDSKFINHIISGRYVYSYEEQLYLSNFLDFRSKQFIDYKVENLYKQVSRECLTKDELLHACVVRGILDSDYKQQLKNYETELDDLKVKLFQYGGTLENESTLKESIKDLRYKYNKLQEFIQKNSDDCVENIVDKYRQDLILKKIAYRKEHFKAVQTANLELQYSATKIREIVRGSTWSQLWSNFGTDIFECDTACLNNFQTTVIQFSNLYQKAPEIEGYDPDIVDDDDKFDGWLIYRSRSNMQQRKQDKYDKMITPANRGADMVFISAQDQDSANEIYASNDAGNKRLIQNREKTIMARGEVRAGAMPDEILEKRQQSTQMYKDKFKNG